MEILKKCNKHPEAFHQRTRIQNETWLYQYNSKDRAQSKLWLIRNGSNSVKAKADCSRAKRHSSSLLSDTQSILLIDFLGDQK